MGKIEKINFGYPKGTLQSVFEHDAVTALELAALTASKVDECVEIVNVVEQTAIEATVIVDEMREDQQAFITENADIRATLISENQVFIEGLDIAKDGIIVQLTNSFNTFKTELNNSKSTYEQNMTSSLNTFKTDITQVKDTFLGGLDAEINQNMINRINYIVNEGALGIMTDADKNFVRVTGETKQNAQARVDILADQVDAKLAQVVKVFKGATNPTQAQIDLMKDGDMYLVYGDVYLPTI